MVYNGKAYEQMDDLGGKNHYFWKHPLGFGPGFRGAFAGLLNFSARNVYERMQGLGGQNIP